MGRTKEFVVEEALGKALKVFWDKGYEAASIADLSGGMGIQRASLYSTFGSKAELYEAALLEYQAKGLAFTESLIAEGKDPIDSFRKLLESTIPKPNCTDNGCFCTNASIELAPHDPQIAQLLSSHFNKVSQRLAKVAAAGQAEGQIPITLNPMDVGAYVLTCLQGLHVTSRTIKDPEELKKRIELMLLALTSR